MKARRPSAPMLTKPFLTRVFSSFPSCPPIRKSSSSRCKTALDHQTIALDVLDVLNVLNVLNTWLDVSYRVFVRQQIFSYAKKVLPVLSQSFHESFLRKKKENSKFIF